jgi:response regulator RpfG family c-di-GMP phosphodiesterase
MTPADARRICDGNPERVDLLIANVVLPVESGPKFACELIAVDPHLKILFSSGTPMAHWPQPDFQAMATLPAGSYSFLANPFKAEELVRKVHELIGRAEKIA